MLDPKQLVWRCRRGVRELDVLFARYLDSHCYAQLDATQYAAFERLLDVQDPVIMDWIFVRSEPEDKEIMFIINQLRETSNL